MTKLERAYVPPEEIEKAIAANVDAWRKGDPSMRACTPDMNEEQAAEHIAALTRKSVEATVYRNDIYQVAVYDDGLIVHLSIKRNDRQPCRDWRHLQRIKNELVGPECEGVELYPAESRLVDCANQFHLWVIKDPAIRFPFGFASGRQVSESTIYRSKQRPFDEE